MKKESELKVVEDTMEARSVEDLRHAFGSTQKQ